MNVESAHKSNWEISEVVFGIPFLIGLALHFVVPFSLPVWLLRLVLLIIGIVFMILGVGWIILARRELARFRQPTDPGRPTSQIVKTGVFAISRNPLYLGCVFFLLGVGFTFSSLWILLMLLVSIILCHYVLIVPEERYLAVKFGDEYQQYKASVRRWLGHK